MYKSEVNKLPKSTVELLIIIPWSEVSASFEKILDKLTSAAELPGFRKGKAPKKVVSDHIDKTKIYEEVIKDLVPTVYAEVIKQHQLKPIISPKIEVMKAEENSDWEIKATLAEKPAVQLKTYQEKIRSLKASKSTNIWVPGKSEDKSKDEVKKTSLEDILKVLIEEVEVEISDLLIADEANRLLSNLIDQTQKLGLTVEQYLIAQHKTSEQLRAEYAQNASRNLKLEFALSEIAEKENITVSQADIDGLLAKIEKPEERSKMAKESYYLASLIRQQKTLDFLSGL